jgi:ribosomal-protein-alanine N-acetyltransferase
MFELRTARLVLRDLVEDDWTSIHAMSQESSVIRYQSWLRLTSEADARRWVQQAMRHNQLHPRQAYNLAVVHQAPHQLIGWLGWGRPSDRTRGDYDFGYALLPSAWGQGYMTEALQATIGYLFGSLAATRIFGECARSNRASARVMQKAGMTLIDEWDERDPATDTIEAHHRYAIHVTEWRPQHHEQIAR